MAIIPMICASRSNIETIPNSMLINYYPGETLEDLNYQKSQNTSDEDKLIKYADQIRMIHLATPDDVSKTYRDNSDLIDAIRMIGPVGCTVHYKTPKCVADENMLFDQILRLHLDMPEVVWYIENEHDDICGVIGLIQRLRDVGVKAYMCLDTCHLQMDVYKALHRGNRYRHSIIDYISTFSRYIGAYHVSASRGYEGLIHETHGKPIGSEDDSMYFYHLVRTLSHLEYENDVYMIPEVTENDYTAAGGRVNGKLAYDIITMALAEQNRRGNA